MFWEWLFKKIPPRTSVCSAVCKDSHNPRLWEGGSSTVLIRFLPMGPAELGSSCSRFAKDSGDPASIAGISEGFSK